MARKRTTIQRETVEEGLDRMPSLPESETEIVTRESGSAADQRADIEIDDILAEVGSTAVVRIQRVNPETGVPAHVGQIPSDGFSLETLADTFGGGRYHLRVFVGREQKGGRLIVEIDPTIPPKNPRARGGPTQQSNNPVNDAMLGMMLRSSEMQQQMMTGFATAMTALVTAATQRPQTDPVEQFTRMAEVLKSNAPPSGNVSQLKEVLEIAELLGNRDADPTLGLVAKGIDTVNEIVKRQPVPAAIPARSPTSVTTLPGATTTPLTPTVTYRPWIAAIAPAMKQLRPLIGGLDPATVADIVEQKLSDEAWADLIADIVADIPAGTPLTNEAVNPFVQRTAPVLQIPADRMQWFTDLAREVLVIANDAEQQNETVADAVTE